MQIPIEPRPPLARNPPPHPNIDPTQISLPLSPRHADKLRHAPLMLGIKPRMPRSRHRLQFKRLGSDGLDFFFELQALGFAKGGYDALVNAEGLEGCAVDFSSKGEFGLGGGGHGGEEDVGFVLFPGFGESRVVLAGFDLGGEEEGFLVGGVFGAWIDGLRRVDQRAADL